MSNQTKAKENLFCSHDKNKKTELKKGTNPLFVWGTHLIQ